MAAANQLTVTVEAAAHDAMNTIALRLARDHGVYIETVQFRWVELTSGNRLLDSIRIESVTRAKPLEEK